MILYRFRSASSLRRERAKERLRQLEFERAQILAAFPELGAARRAVAMEHEVPTLKLAPVLRRYN